MKKCPECSTEVREDLAICPQCDAIIDFSALGLDELNTPSPGGPIAPSSKPNIVMQKATFSMKESETKESFIPQSGSRRTLRANDGIWQLKYGIYMTVIMGLASILNFLPWFYVKGSSFSMNGLHYGGWYFLFLETIFIFSPSLSYFWGKFVLYQKNSCYFLLLFLWSMYFYYFYSIKNGTIVDQRILDSHLTAQLSPTSWFKLKALLLFSLSVLYFLSVKRKKAHGRKSS